jgi:two-component system, sensor histidine kinase and response regulator
LGIVKGDGPQWKHLKLKQIQAFMGKPVVICVDDEPIVLESLKVELRQSLGNDCLIETAEDGFEALELFSDLIDKNCQIALVVADYIMPGMKGDEVLKQIHDLSPHTLNIMLSGQADLSAVSNAVKYARLYRYITKPWQREDFTLTVTEAVQSYLQGRALEAQTLKLKQLYQQVQEFNVTLEHQIQSRTAQLRQKVKEVEDLSELKDDFLHAVSHDLRTPQMGMLLVLQNLQKQPDETIHLSRPVLNRMVESLERQLEMLNSLLDARFTEVQGLHLNFQSVHFWELVDSVVHDLEPLVNKHQATLINQVPSNLPSVMADAAQLRRVLENLMTNALKHNRPGVQLVLNAKAEAGTIRCSIADNGVGISRADCATLFNRYARRSRTRLTPGIGLGLYLCRQIIAAHGGEIGVTSVPEQGATFWFTLPLESSL